MQAVYIQKYKSPLYPEIDATSELIYVAKKPTLKNRIEYTVSWIFLLPVQSKLERESQPSRHGKEDDKKSFVAVNNYRLDVVWLFVC